MITPEGPHQVSENRAPSSGDTEDARTSPTRRPGPLRRQATLVASAAAVIVGVGVSATWWTRASGSAATNAATPSELRDVPRDEGGAIVISDSYAHRIGLTFGTVERGVLTPVAKVVGTVELDPRRVTAVGTRTSGFVKHVFKLEGDDVRAGEALAEIESAELGQAQANLTTARAEQQAARINAARETALLRDHLTTARESEEAAATLSAREASLAAAEQALLALGGDTHGPLGLRVLRSPIAGHVVDALISVGQSVEPHKLAFRVANLDSVWIELDIFERTVGQVRVGDAVEVTPMADLKRPIRGNVAHVGELIDANSRSTDVRVQVDNRERRLRPGQAVSALIRLSGPGRDALTIPSESVTYVDDTPTVFVASSPNRLVPTKIRIGLTDGIREEIVSGVPEGARVVNGGVFALKSELFR
jgi:cobalt-zinc-cadmium efflux system membrane fusion protein